MSSIGVTAQASSPKEKLVQAKTLAAQLPDLLIEAKRVANTIMDGWHGRRRQGSGDDFWQFRPYNQGDNLAHIDWRRSARDDHVYIREREWQSAHTVWLWADMSASMRYRSQLAQFSKEEKALTTALALAEILALSGERIGWPHIMPPSAMRHGAEKLVNLLMENIFLHPDLLANLPEASFYTPYSEVIIMSDFLQTPAELQSLLDNLSNKSVRAHFIEIADPAEETFPYYGRTEFIDPESGRTMTAERAETYAEDYKKLYLQRRETIENYCHRLGWTYLTHHTDKSLSPILLQLHERLGMSAGVNI